MSWEIWAGCIWGTSQWRCANGVASAVSRRRWWCWRGSFCRPSSLTCRWSTPTCSCFATSSSSKVKERYFPLYKNNPNVHRFVLHCCGFHFILIYLSLKGTKVRCAKCCRWRGPLSTIGESVQNVLGPLYNLTSDIKDNWLNHSFILPFSHPHFNVVFGERCRVWLVYLLL